MATLSRRSPPACESGPKLSGSVPLLFLLNATEKKMTSRLDVFEIFHKQSVGRLEGLGYPLIV